MKKTLEQALASMDLQIKVLLKEADSQGKHANGFNHSLMLDEAIWGVMYASRALQSILEDLEIEQVLQNEEAASHKKKKPQVRRSSSMGDSDVLSKPNNRVRRKTKGV